MLFVADQFTGYRSVARVEVPAAFLCKQTPRDYLTGWERGLRRSIDSAGNANLALPIFKTTSGSRAAGEGKP